MDRDPHHAPPFRAPAVPLVTHDPFFSIWSQHDRLTDGETTHWTGRTHPLTGLVRIDGAVHRFCGAEPRHAPMEQVSLALTATATTYTFRGGGVRLALSFCSPLLCEDLAVLSRPATYVCVEVESTDGREHEVGVHLDAGAEIAVDRWDQAVVWARYDLGALEAVRTGCADQRPLHRVGDDMRIDWGWLYLAAERGQRAVLSMGAREAIREAFAAGAASPSDDLDMPRSACLRHPVLAARLELGRVGARCVQRQLIIAYDDVASVEFLGRRLGGYWRAGRVGFDAMLAAAALEREAILARCRDLDRCIAEGASQAAGAGFAELAALSYRQSIAAHALVRDCDGTAYFLSKENFSNGCIATVDVAFPSSPLFLVFNVALVRAMLEPVMRYAATPAWRFPFAPHDLGTYPLANGQVYGGGEISERDQMPIEESGNILILAAAIAEVEGDAGFAASHWALLERWAVYVRELGFDPPNQLCTDDFAGHLAGNCNLSLKAILGLGSFARLCERRGLADDARSWRRTAEDFAARWRTRSDDGGHARLAFDQPGTWSQKYTLVWDRVLGLDLFPAEVAEREARQYLAQLKPFGVPLDSRHTYTTIDHTIWSACLASDADARRIIDACRDYACATPDRVPLCDWYDTVSGRRQAFQARSVVGGVFMPLMRDRARWQVWIDRQRQLTGAVERA